jgi:hypothetical protein
MIGRAVEERLIAPFAVFDVRDAFAERRRSDNRAVPVVTPIEFRAMAVRVGTAEFAAEGTLVTRRTVSGRAVYDGVIETRQRGDGSRVASRVTSGPDGTPIDQVVVRVAAPGFQPAIVNVARGRLLGRNAIEVGLLPDANYPFERVQRLPGERSVVLRGTVVDATPDGVKPAKPFAVTISVDHGAYPVALDHNGSWAVAIANTAPWAPPQPGLPDELLIHCAVVSIGDGWQVVSDSDDVGDGWSAAGTIDLTLVADLDNPRIPPLRVRAI